METVNALVAAYNFRQSSEAKGGNLFMLIIKTIPDMRAYVSSIKSSGGKIGFVPTMGYLHKGHLDLMRKAKEYASHVIASIFVNPTQFGPNEDLAKYPRDFQRDEELCTEVGVECIFFPEPPEIYPDGYATYITVEGLSTGLCGVSRPTHFRGVATVVAKLFNIVEPDFAVFGEKDYQQLAVIKHMVKDLDMRVEVIGYPTVREADGLAMSSRNAYLSPEEREIAPVLNRSLRHALSLFRKGETNAKTIKEEVVSMIEAATGCIIDYVEIVDGGSLVPVETVTESTVMAVAVKLGRTRLIDNINFAS
jgi:pantoate--beta-alanine ligase